MNNFPYPGLRPFQCNENEIFFGRDPQIDELITRLESTHFLAVVGLSGCGKSSLVRAGLLADLETGFLADAGVNWQVAEMRPSNRPFIRLAEALLETTFGQVYMPNLKNRAEATGFLQAELQGVSLIGLQSLLQETPLPSDSNLLVFVDQFEEIFRYYQDVDKEEAEKFVALLLASSQDPSFNRVYVILTMRSDFIGHCALFHGLPEAINKSQFLTPRLTREQLREAIVAPARVFGGNIEETLVNQLLNDAGNDFDQLPLLQHALMRMWHLAYAENPETVIITSKYYEQIGGLKNALSKHADEIYTKLDPSQRKIIEILFRCLTEDNSDRRDTRRPVKLEEIAELANVSCEQVATVVEIFRHEGRNFLTPPNKALEPNTVIDISHETLIRQWQCLNKWTEEEIESATIYQRLEDTACLWNKEKSALLRTPELEYTLAWRDREKPTEQWSKRYGEHFGLAMDFLQESQKQQKREQAEARQQCELQQRKREHWQRRITVSLLIFLTVALGLAGVAGWQWLEAEKQRQLVEEQNQKLNLSMEASDLQRAGAEAYYSGVYSIALEKWQAGLKQALEINDKSYETEFISYIAIVYQALNQNKQALDYYQQALKIQGEIGDKRGQVPVLNNIGDIYQNLGNYPKALDYYNHALTIDKEIDNKRGIGNNLTNIGMVYQNLGIYQKALDYYKKALVIYREIADISGVRNNLTNIAAVYQNLGIYQTALDFYQKSLGITHEIGHRSWEAADLTNIGIMYTKLEQYQKALDYYKKALTIHREIGDKRGIGNILANIGMVYQNLGQYQKALDYYKKALIIKREIGELSGEEADLTNLKAYFYQGNNYQKALDYLQQVWKISTEIGDKDNAAIAATK